ncbi:suppressor of tub2 mutation [Exophiala dermatitidis]|nr:suppressor of tub2 mutation [Exophiala dermatitidis]KAJ4549746.1 suppressor of tub2 mutation [Exophiala dermatitidis]
MGFLSKVDRLIPVAGKAIYFTITGLRAKMLGTTYVDVLNFLHYELTLPETEESWKKRQDLLVKLSEIFDNRKDNSVLPKDFVERVKAILPDIVTTALSERTTLSTQACRVISKVAQHLETQIQPQLDILLPQLIVLCGSAKGVNQKNANETIINICKHAGYSPRLFYHVCSAIRDKRIPPRTYAPEWLRILLTSYRTQMDREKDGEAARKAIYQGLTDGQIKVRENSRAVYWEYAKYDAQGARMIMGGLNPHAQAALREDSHNPDKSAAKAGKAPRPGSAIASIKAQNKQLMQQRRGFTPASIKPEDFVFGSMESLDAPTYKKSAQKVAAETSGERQDRHALETPQASHHGEPTGSSRQGTSAHSRNVIFKSSKDNKLEITKELKPASPQVDARPLLSAPVRRGRIVATPMAAPTHRPGSRGEATKKPVELKDKSLSDKSSGRQTPVNTEKEYLSSTVIHHRKVPSRHDAVRYDEKDLPVASGLQNLKRSGRQTPVSADDKEHSAPSSTQPAKKADRPITIIAEDKTEPAHANIMPAKETIAPEQAAEAPSQSAALPLRPVRAFAPENQSLPPADLTNDKGSSHLHVAEGKENSYVVRPRKKRSPGTSPRRSPNRSPQRSPRRNSVGASAKKSLTAAMEYLRRGSLDALGYRRLRKLIENHPGVLITRQSQFNELYELLIGKLASLDEITESREKRLETLSHPAYHRHTIILTLFILTQQYPQWQEPQPGMTLSALLVARCNHSSGYVSTLRAIDDSAGVLCSTTPNILPSIDAVLDTLEQVEHIITTNDPIITPTSTTTIICNSLQSLASDFGPERPRFSNRLPIIMAFGLKILCVLLGRLRSGSQSLYTIQEDRLASFAEHLLATYTSVIKRYVMEYCTALHAVIKPEKRFYQFFSKESDRNLIHYYVAGASGMVYGSLGNTGRVVMPEDDFIDDEMEREPATFDPGSEMSANLKLLQTAGMDQAIAVPPGNLTSMGDDQLAASSGNWQILGTTADDA